MLAPKLAREVQRGLEVLRGEVPGRVCQHLPVVRKPDIHGFVPLGRGRFAVNVTDEANGVVYMLGPYTIGDLDEHFDNRLTMRIMAPFN